jgi:hypothetical protein
VQTDEDSLRICLILDTALNVNIIPLIIPGETLRYVLNVRVELGTLTTNYLAMPDKRKSNAKRASHYIHATIIP